MHYICESLATVATSALRSIGVAASRNGSLIMVRDGNVSLNVIPQCSGVRSVLILLLLGFVFSLTEKCSLLKSIEAGVISAAIALVVNLFRIVSVVAFADIFGDGSALEYFHDFSGYVFFIISALFSIGMIRRL